MRRSNEILKECNAYTNQFLEKSGYPEDSCKVIVEEERFEGEEDEIVGHTYYLEVKGYDKPIPLLGLSITGIDFYRDNTSEGYMINDYIEGIIYAINGLDVKEVFAEVKDEDYDEMFFQVQNALEHKEFVFELMGLPARLQGHLERKGLGV